MFLYVGIMLFSCFLSIVGFRYKLKEDNILYGTLIILLGFISAIRYETGQDWMNYRFYFNNINVDLSPIKSYNSDAYNFTFEYGYFLLNYIFKFIGLNYSAVLFCASIFFSYCLLLYTSQFKGNKFIVSTLYISYPYLILLFAQVRQSIALGFFLIGFYLLLKGKSKVVSIIVACIGLFFQVSSVIYILGLLLVIFFPKERKHQFLLLFILGVIVIVINGLDFFELLKMLSPSEMIEGKLEFYENEQSNQGLGQVIYSLYLLFCFGYMLFYQNKIERRSQIIVNYSIVSALLTVLISYFFQGSYVMYSRIYLVTCIFLGCALSIIHYERKSFLTFSFTCISLLIALVYYIRLVNFYSFEYLPYKTWVMNLIYVTD